MADTPTFAGWAILEILGHRRLGGWVAETQVAGAGFLRIDVPGDGDDPVASQFYPPSAIYCLTPTSEDAARLVAKQNRPEPVHRYELPRGTSGIVTCDDCDEAPCSCFGPGL